MKTIVPLFLLIFALGCVKGKRDTTYTFTCATTCKTDSLTNVTTDTMLFNYTDGDANLYARAHTGGRCTTICER